MTHWARPGRAPVFSRRQLASDNNSGDLCRGTVLDIDSEGLSGWGDRQDLRGHQMRMVELGRPGWIIVDYR